MKDLRSTPFCRLHEHQIQDMMELSVSQVPPKSNYYLLDTDKNTASPFLSLPPEIRLLIYNELLVQSDDLLRTFCKCNFCARLKHRTIGKDCLTTSLLRTNKAIYNEALPILYAKNIFSFLCYGPFRHSAELGVFTHHLGRPRFIARAGDKGFKIGLLANRYSPWAGVTKIITCPSDTAKLHPFVGFQGQTESCARSLVRFLASPTTRIIWLCQHPSPYPMGHSASIKVC